MAPSTVAAASYDYVTPALTCGPVPTFGTAEWVALADDDPAKQAAVVRAALAHWGATQAQADNHVQASHAISGAHDWAGLAARPTREQVLRYRAAG
jgi:hypothetical protein